MHRTFAQKLSASLFFLFGALALAVSSSGVWVPRGSEHAAQILASFVAISMCLSGAVWFLWPKYGIALAIGTLIPQAFSFAFGPVGYALHLLPNYCLELSILARDEAPIDVFLHRFSGTPEAMLYTGAGYTGIGLGIDLVSFSILLCLSYMLSRSRRPLGSPNQSFKPTPSARLNSRR